MTIIRCPRCHDEVTAPAKASRLAIVRCPLCLEEYPLADALRQVPPALIVVGGEAEAEAAPEPGDWDALEAAGAASAGVGAGAFDASPGAGVAAPAPARPVVKGARPKRRERSAIGNFLGIVFGGLGGIVLGLLVLWWGFKQDVGVGPTVAKYAPWIVPAQFHGTPESAVSPSATAAAANTAGASRKKSQPAAAPKKQPDGELLQGGAFEPGSLPEGPTSPLTPASANVDLPMVDPPTLPAAAPGKAKTPDLTDLLPAGTPPAPAIAPPAARPPTAEEFAVAVTAASEALARYDNAAGDDNEAKRVKFTEMYLAVSEAGRVVSQLNAQDAALEAPVGELKALLEKIAGVGGPSKLSGVKFLAATQWPQRKPAEGFLVAGVVKELKPAGPHFDLTLDASRGGLPLEIPVVSLNNPEDFCQIGDELVVAGRIIDDPKANLPGYEGAAARVVLLGYCTKAPK